MLAAPSRCTLEEEADWDIGNQHCKIKRRKPSTSYRWFWRIWPSCLFFIWGQFCYICLLAHTCYIVCCWLCWSCLSWIFYCYKSYFFKIAFTIWRHQQRKRMRQHARRVTVRGLPSDKSCYCSLVLELHMNMKISFCMICLSEMFLCCLDTFSAGNWNYDVYLFVKSAELMLWLLLKLIPERPECFSSVVALFGFIGRFLSFFYILSYEIFWTILISGSCVTWHCTMCIF